ncbi:MAG: CPBP family intramembrane metalloprotease [Oscillospiraceae bacterium]|nr:CPBP family intramembrane metalloprotease [Oscillospiraceae bacterium]
MSRLDSPARRILAALLPALLYLVLDAAVQAGLRAGGLPPALCTLIAALPLAFAALVWYRRRMPPRQEAIPTPGAVCVWVLFALGFSAALQLLPGARAAGDTGLLPIAAYAFAAPAAEELVYRGLVFRRGEALVGRGWALAFSSLLFAAGHGWPGALPALFLGLVLGLLTDKEQSLVPPLIVHILVNLMSYIWPLVPLPVFCSALGAAVSLAVFVRLVLRPGEGR